MLKRKFILGFWAQIKLSVLSITKTPEVLVGLLGTLAGTLVLYPHYLFRKIRRGLMTSDTEFPQIICICVTATFHSQLPDLFSLGYHFATLGTCHKGGFCPSCFSEVGCEFQKSATWLSTCSLVPVKHLVSTASTRQLL